MENNYETQLGYKPPRGSLKDPILIGRDSATAFLLKFGPMQPLYAFDIRTGKGRGRLSQWRVSNEQLDLVKAAIENG